LQKPLWGKALHCTTDQQGTTERIAKTPVGKSPALYHQWRRESWDQQRTTENCKNPCGEKPCTVPPMEARKLGAERVMISVVGRCEKGDRTITVLDGAKN